MKLKPYPNASSFLEDNLSLLEQEEAANNLMLGIALGIKQETYIYKKAHFLGVLKRGHSIFCALQTPPRNLLIYGMPEQSSDCASIIYDHVTREGIVVPGFLGPKAVVETFADNWSIRAGKTWSIKQAMGLFQLKTVIPPVQSAGSMRRAALEDKELAFRWMCAFHSEALGEVDEAFCRKLVERHLEQKTLFFWENREPVSMAAAARPTRNGSTVNAVYTPPEHRGMGYASNCVAQLSQQLLDSGYQFCALFTNLSNPTSNKIYQAIGYRKVAEFVEAKLIGAQLINQ